MTLFSTFFHDYCQHKGFAVDPSQIPLIAALEQWRSPKGWYIWGDVGRGKTTLAKAFYEFYPSKKKQWIHFTEWNILIQRQLALYSACSGLKNTLFSFKFWKSPIEKVAQDISHLNDILFLDEFSLNHIADAVIIQKLFNLLLQKGVKIVITSNTSPDSLYEDGLNRDRLTDLFRLLKTQLIVVNLSGDEDFRRRKITKNFYYFLDKQKMETLIKASVMPEQLTTLAIVQGQRTFDFNKTYKDIAVCSFDELCSKNRSLQDYQLLFSYVNTLFLYDLPQFTPENTNSIKRFIVLIDFLYENHINLSIHGLVPFKKICDSSLDPTFLKRTFSRLLEMLYKNTEF